MRSVIITYSGFNLDYITPMHIYPYYIINSGYLTAYRGWNVLAVL